MKSAGPAGPSWGLCRVRAVLPSLGGLAAQTRSGGGVAQMDTWTEAAEITSEQKNFLLLSALYKFVFTRMCVHTCTRSRTWVDWAWSPESNKEGRQQTRCALGAGRGTWAAAHAALSRGLGLGTGGGSVCG